MEVDVTKLKNTVSQSYINALYREADKPESIIF